MDHLKERRLAEAEAAARPSQCTLFCQSLVGILEKYPEQDQFPLQLAIMKTVSDYGRPPAPSAAGSGQVNTLRYNHDEIMNPQSVPLPLPITSHVTTPRSTRVTPSTSVARLIPSTATTLLGSTPVSHANPGRAQVCITPSPSGYVIASMNRNPPTVRHAVSLSSASPAPDNLASVLRKK